MYLASIPYLCTKNETMVSLLVATVTVERELPIVNCTTHHGGQPQYNNIISHMRGRERGRERIKVKRSRDCSQMMKN